MMERASARIHLRRVVAGILELDVETVAPDALFHEDLGATSLERMEIVDSVAAEFRVRLDPDDAVAVRSVEDTLTVLEGRGVVVADGVGP
jgi:acyl carrier protein